MNAGFGMEGEKSLRTLRERLAAFHWIDEMRHELGLVLPGHGAELAFPTGPVRILVPEEDSP